MPSSSHVTVSQSAAPTSLLRIVVEHTDETLFGMDARGSPHSFPVEKNISYIPHE